MERASRTSPIRLGSLPRSREWTPRKSLASWWAVDGGAIASRHVENGCAHVSLTHLQHLEMEEVSHLLPTTGPQDPSVDNGASVGVAVKDGAGLTDVEVVRLTVVEPVVVAAEDGCVEF